MQPAPLIYVIRQLVCRSCDFVRLAAVAVPPMAITNS